MTVKATFFLPLRDNDGTDLRAAIAEVEDSCFVSFGAWTLAGHFRGAWRMQSGERAMDTSAVYSVILRDDDLGALEAILRRFKAQTSQEAIYLEVIRQIDLRLL